MSFPWTPVLAYGAAPSSEVRLHILFAGFQTGALSLLADALELVAIAWYLGCVWRLRRRGRRWSPWATASFCGGVAVVFVAVGSGLAAYDEVNVAMHALQHVLLMMVAAPLLALGKPITLAVQAAKRSNQVRILSVVHSTAFSVLTFPLLAWFLYYGVMYVYFLDTQVYDYTIAHPLAHDASHLVFLIVGYLYWQPLIGTDPSRWRLPHPVRIASMFLGMPFEAFLGIAVSLTTTPIDPINSLENTRQGGNVFWIAAMAASALCILVEGIAWLRQMERQAAREDRRASSEALRSVERAAELGMQSVREGWSVPWWRLAEAEARQQSAGARQASRAAQVPQRSAGAQRDARAAEAPRAPAASDSDLT